MSKIGKTMAESDRKLGELILYISRESVEDPNFGSIKLNKILYFSDFLAYGNLGKAITGAEYQHLDHGPAPRRLKPVRDGLVESRALSFEARVTSFGYRQNRTIALRNPDLSIFEADEIKLVDEVMMALSNSNAVEASEISHRQVGWKSTKLGESIPYESIFVSDEPLSPAEIRFAQSKWARQHRQSSAEAHEF